MTIAAQFIQFALSQDVLRFGEFKTKAGRLSPYFFNAGLFNDGLSLLTIANAYADVLLEKRANGFEFDILNKLFRKRRRSEKFDFWKICFKNFEKSFEKVLDKWKTVWYNK